MSGLLTRSIFKSLGTLIPKTSVSGQGKTLICPIPREPPFGRSHHKNVAEEPHDKEPSMNVEGIPSQLRTIRTIPVSNFSELNPDPYYELPGNENSVPLRGVVPFNLQHA
uniref:Uncharacterized protein n=1 Tax=Megaselia scalaris TaxID=36166 RepID=T1GPI3_MEGSC